jgi:methyltransferase of ATP-grasp peptide maturase system
VSEPLEVLAGELEAVGLLPPEWRKAVDAAPRHLFVPETIWVARDGGGWRPLSQRREPDAWWELVNRDGYIVTQVDDGRHAEPGAVGEYSTSSASQPSLVLRMLNELEVERGQRVLEVGTGTGWNAALLSARLGDDAVTTIEVDAELAETARRTLMAAGFRPAVITGDGSAGHPQGAPYDRVIATASVQRIPAAWIAQTKPGGVILTPYGDAYHNDALLKLTVGGDGTASGRFVGRAAFMWLRQDRVLLGSLRDYVHADDQPDRKTTRLDPRTVFGDPDVDFAVAARVRDCGWHRVNAPDGSDEFTIWLLGLTGERSWASVDFEGPAPYAVEQYGPRRLWDEVEASYRWWQQAGRPPTDRFGLTVGPDGQQLWLDSVDNLVPPQSCSVSDSVTDSR